MSLIADTALGRLEGLRHRGVVQFRGVPCSRAERFGPPVPVGPWTGVRDATAHGPIAPQGPSRLRVAVGDVHRPQSEDCLTLTVTTPAVDDRRRPVLVWLHGGGYSAGAGSLDRYDGAGLASEGDVVVVGANYRLGPLGFLGHDGLADGRMGLDDMIAAVRWVTAHIEAFGGDPDAITLVGQSAGAHAILCMLATPQVRSLFRRAILQSTPAGIAPLSHREATDRARRYADVLGLDDAGFRRRLRNAETSVLLSGAAALARGSARPGVVEPPFLPVVDELSAPGALLAAAARGAAESGISVVVGTNRDEARAMVAGAPDATREQVEAYLRGSGDEAAAAPHLERLAAGEHPADVLPDAMTDLAFTRPSLRFADLAARAGAPVWTYRLDWAPADNPFGACHCLELPLVFDTFPAWADAPMLDGTARDATDGAHVGRAMRTAWLSLAHHGSPGSAAGWPAHDPDRTATRVFDANLDRPSERTPT